MARTSENKRHSKYVIRIVCEGDKTEPLFFTDLCDQFYGDSKDFDVRTIPQPNIPVEDAEADSSRGSYKGKKRKVKSGGQKDVAEDEVITGVPPLNGCCMQEKSCLKEWMNLGQYMIRTNILNMRKAWPKPIR